VTASIARLKQRPFAMAEGERLRAREAALRTVDVEIRGLQQLQEALSGAFGESFDRAVDEIRRSRGRVIVSGMGKSGHVGRKIAATFASTGTPAFFVHPAEASHGDLGMVTADDVILALSWSGETTELGDIIHFSRRFSVPLVAITSKPESTLARAADVALVLPRAEEACPHGLAPTTSTVMQLSIGDALAVALLESRGFTARDFRDFHPGGKLGARLLGVDTLMHSGEDMPVVALGASMAEVILAISGKRMGCVAVVDGEGRLVGIVTDGDLRRKMSADIMDQPLAGVMTANPVTIPSGELASSALEMMNSRKITVLFVVSGSKPVGAVHIHDLLKAGVA
jgi:arabinose-5-phosphate isomerase